MKLAHQKEGGDDAEEEEEDFSPPARFETRGKDRGDRREPRGSRTNAPPEERGARHGDGERPARAASGATARIYVGAGRNTGIRPQDLVGAIANESGIKGNQIGAIEIADKYSIVELPEGVLDQVVETMKKSMLKGRKVTVRRFIEKGEAGK
jgi:ATP-dependent RNA helicase DeaD